MSSSRQKLFMLKTLSEHRKQIQRSQEILEKSQKTIFADQDGNFQNIQYNNFENKDKPKDDKQKSNGNRSHKKSANTQNNKNERVSEPIGNNIRNNKNNGDKNHFNGNFRNKYGSNFQNNNFAKQKLHFSNELQISNAIGESERFFRETVKIDRREPNSAVPKNGDKNNKSGTGHYNLKITDEGSVGSNVPKMDVKGDATTKVRDKINPKTGLKNLSSDGKKDEDLSHENEYQLNKATKDAAQVDRTFKKQGKEIIERGIDELSKTTNISVLEKRDKQKLKNAIYDKKSDDEKGNEENIDDEILTVTTMKMEQNKGRSPESSETSVKNEKTNDSNTPPEKIKNLNNLGTNINLPPSTNKGNDFKINNNFQKSESENFANSKLESLFSENVIQESDQISETTEDQTTVLKIAPKSGRKPPNIIPNAKPNDRMLQTINFLQTKFKTMNKKPSNLGKTVENILRMSPNQNLKYFIKNNTTVKKYENFCQVNPNISTKYRDILNKREQFNNFYNPVRQEIPKKIFKNPITMPKIGSTNNKGFHNEPEDHNINISLVKNDDDPKLTLEKEELISRIRELLERAVARRKLKEKVNDRGHDNNLEKENITEEPDKKINEQTKHDLMKNCKEFVENLQIDKITNKKQDSKTDPKTQHIETYKKIDAEVKKKEFEMSSLGSSAGKQDKMNMMLKNRGEEDENKITPNSKDGTEFVSAQQRVMKVFGEFQENKDMVRGAEQLTEMIHSIREWPESDWQSIIDSGAEEPNVSDNIKSNVIKIDEIASKVDKGIVTDNGKPSKKVDDKHLHREPQELSESSNPQTLSRTAPNINNKVKACEIAIIHWSEPETFQNGLQINQNNHNKSSNQYVANINPNTSNVTNESDQFDLTKNQSDKNVTENIKNVSNFEELSPESLQIQWQRNQMRRKIMHFIRNLNTDNNDTGVKRKYFKISQPPANKLYKQATQQQQNIQESKRTVGENEQDSQNIAASSENTKQNPTHIDRDVQEDFKGRPQEKKIPDSEGSKKSAKGDSSNSDRSGSNFTPHMESMRVERNSMAVTQESVEILVVETQQIVDVKDDPSKWGTDKFLVPKQNPIQKKDGTKKANGEQDGLQDKEIQIVKTEEEKTSKNKTMESGTNIRSKRPKIISITEDNIAKRDRNVKKADILLHKDIQNIISKYNKTRKNADITMTEVQNASQPQDIHTTHEDADKYTFYHYPDEDIKQKPDEAQMKIKFNDLIRKMTALEKKLDYLDDILYSISEELNKRYSSKIGRSRSFHGPDKRPEDKPDGKDDDGKNSGDTDGGSNPSDDISHVVKKPPLKKLTSTKNTNSSNEHKQDNLPSDDKIKKMDNKNDKSDKKIVLTKGQKAIDLKQNLIKVGLKIIKIEQKLEKLQLAAQASHSDEKLDILFEKINDIGNKICMIKMRINQIYENTPDSSDLPVLPGIEKSLRRHKTSIRGYKPGEDEETNTDIKEDVTSTILDMVIDMLNNRNSSGKGLDGNLSAVNLGNSSAHHGQMNDSCNPNVCRKNDDPRRLLKRSQASNGRNKTKRSNGKRKMLVKTRHSHMLAQHADQNVQEIVLTAQNHAQLIRKAKLMRREKQKIKDETGSKETRERI